ncbi:hypothetical protein [Streptomyces scopuliridis]|uniref:hypothetical protein n=1 Tax=Streptomyces scopuliridis TaxID=452529 RepID=UPI003413F1A0
MDQREAVQQAISVLTQSREVAERRAANPGRTDLDAEHQLLGRLIGEVLRIPLNIPAGTPPEDAVALYVKALDQRLTDFVGGFTVAFMRLAQYHEAGCYDVSAEDVLRELALDMDGTAEPDGR